MKRNLILIVAIFIGIILIMLAGNIITIGDKIGQFTHPYAELGFYLLMAVLFIVLIIRPILRVHHAPEFPKLTIDNQWDAAQLLGFGKKLANNCNYISDPEQRKQHRLKLKQDIALHAADTNELKQVIGKELSLRIEGDKSQQILGINDRIKEWAKTVFMITAISQNSKVDSLSVIYLNYKMIEEIILASGFRPTQRQLFKQYANILGTALITYFTAEMVDELDDLDFLAGDTVEEAGTDGSLGVTLLNKLRSSATANLILGSVIEGTTNALLTLRIGYVTRSYLLNGSDAFTGYKNKRRIKRQAMKEAICNIPSIVVQGSKAVGGKTAQLVLSVLGLSKEEKPELNTSK